MDIICQTVDKWGESVYVSFNYWPMNQIYISETDSGMTVLTVGYLKLDKGALDGGTPMTASYYVGVHAYVVMEDSKSIKAYEPDVSDWRNNGVRIDLETMGEEELREAIEQSYLYFINQD